MTHRWKRSRTFFSQLTRIQPASYFYRYARESLFLDIARDALGDELTTDEISRKEAHLDADLLKLIQKACSNTSSKPTRQARALDLTRMLHHGALVEKAIQIAQFYRLRGLEDKMRRIRAERDDEDRLLAARERRREWASDLDAVPPPAQPLAPRATGNGRPKPFEDFNAPPTIQRPGLARAMAGSTQTQSGSSLTDISHDMDSLSMSPVQEGKRKRVDENDRDLSSEDLAAKRRAILESAGTSKSSKLLLIVSIH
jgi:chromosome transmission fidelity protein 4